MSIRDIVDRDKYVTDHYSGKKLTEFSLSEAEFQILADLERTYSGYKNWAGIGVERLRPNDIYASKDNLLNYLRGLKTAYDHIVETEHGYSLGLSWQATLY